METTATVINVKHGTIDENGQDWAQVNILDDKVTSNDGFFGVQPAKLKVSTANRNELATRHDLHSSQGEHSNALQNETQIRTATCLQ